MKVVKYTTAFLPLFLFVFSFVLQHGFNFKPCNLCIVERYLYLGLFVVLLFDRKIPIAICAICGLAVSVYHKFVQHGLFSTCHIFNGYNNEIDFYQMVQNAVPCTAKMSILGIDAVYFNITFFGLYIVILLIPKLRKQLIG